MSVLSQELNKNLKNIAPQVYNLLSELGKNIFLPEGIVVQSEKAKSAAKRINASIGIATEAGDVMHLNTLQQYFSSMQPNEVFPYAPTAGKISLRTAWKQKIRQDNPSLANKNFYTPVVTQGLTHAINLLSQLFIKKGSKVILPDFYWENYNLIFRTMYQAELQTYQLFFKNRFNYEALQKTLIAQKETSLVVVFNFPHNPTGYAPSAEEVQKIIEILFKVANCGKTLLIICDDAYFGLTYEKNIYPESLFSNLVGLHRNIIAAKIDGASKELYAWGLRVGFLSLAFTSSNQEMAFQIMEKKIQGLLRAGLSNTANPIQSIVEKSLLDSSLIQEKRQKKQILQNRYQKLKKLLANPKYQKAWEVYPFNSGYFFCIKIKNVLAVQLWEYLLQKYQIGLIYLDKQTLRLAYSSVSEQELEELLESIYTAQQELVNKK